MLCVVVVVVVVGEERRREVGRREGERLIEPSGAKVSLKIAETEQPF